MSSTDPFFIVALQGGLGNQLFQYAAALAVKSAMEKRKGQPVKLWLAPVEQNKHSGRDYRQTFYTEGTALEGREGEPQPQDPYFVWWPSDAFYAWSADDLLAAADSMGSEHPLFLRGYFQHLPPIKKVIIPFLRHTILKKIADRRIFMEKKYRIEDPKAAAFVHIRRGDFLEHPEDEFWRQGESYYRAGLKELRAAQPLLQRIFVLSDDPGWCLQQQWIAEEGLELADEPDELHALALMSLCHGGAVIANSSFSWWGAMFGPEASRALVVYPSLWYKNAEPDLFPARWRKIHVGDHPDSTA